MKIILETARTYLREITVADAQTAYLLNADPDVIKYTGDKAFENVEAAKIFLENYGDYKKFNMGRWGVIHKIDSEFLGWCGLKYSEGANEYDIGFRFFKKYWGNGYASETAKACIAHGFQKMNIPVIVGRAMKENIASINVLQKCGMVYVNDFDFDSKPGVIFNIKKENFKPF